ncbi:MAG TPA: hypothetical protein VFO82_04230, partial [Steroidobacteraceae bacterium]|nr:hypothetical protein [Steroidobacteraceae bacterium]
KTHMKNLVARGLIGCLCLFGTGLADAGINSWTTTGPQGGNFADLERSSTVPGTVYATLGHGFYRSLDGGRTWSTAYPLPAQTADIAVDPTNGRRVYVAVVDKGVFRSEDAGRTFVQVASSFSAWSVAVGGTDGATVYYSGQNVFARSTDRGNTWTTQSTPFNSATTLLVDRANPDLITANFQLNIGLSNDGGVSWTYVPSPAGAWIYAMHRVSATELIVGTTSGLHRSLDNGATFSWVGFGSITHIDANPANPTTLLASTGFHSLPYRSVDGGATWQTFGSAPPTWYVKRMLFGAGERLIAGSDEGVFLSSDAGTAWAAAPRGPAASGPYPFAAGATAASPIYASVGPYGLYASYNDGPWVQRVGPQSFSSTVSLAVKPDQPKWVYMSPAQIGIQRSTDGGTTWSDIGGFTGLDFKLAFSPQDTNRLYAVLSYSFYSAASRLFTSADAGTTWEPVTTDLPATLNVQNLVIDPSNGSRMFVNALSGFSPSPAGGLYRSVDGGAHFTNTNVPGQNVWNVAIDPANSNIVYASTTAGLYVSQDGGETFTRNEPFAALTNLEGGSVVIDPKVPSTIYASSFDSGFNFNFGGQRPSTILRSVDRGETWEVLRAATALPAYLSRDLLLDPAEQTRLRASTGRYGLASFEVRNDLSIAIAGHSGTRKVGVPASYDVKVANAGPFHGTRVRVSARIPAGATAVSWQVPPAPGNTCARHRDKIDCEIAVLRTGENAAIRVNYTPTLTGPIIVYASAEARERDLEWVNDIAAAIATAVR